jgi:hypothetical protein
VGFDFGFVVGFGVGFAVGFKLVGNFVGFSEPNTEDTPLDRKATVGFFDRTSPSPSTLGVGEGELVIAGSIVSKRGDGPEKEAFCGERVTLAFVGNRVGF